MKSFDLSAGLALQDPIRGIYVFYPGDPAGAIIDLNERMYWIWIRKLAQV